MVDLSAAGNVTVTIQPQDGEAITFTPADFSDEGAPVRYGREEVVHSQIDMNGKYFSNTLRRLLTVELHPLPNSEADVKFTEWLLKQRNEGQAEALIESLTIKWTFTRGTNFQKRTSTLTYTDGTVANGAFGNDASAEGRFSTNPYLFRFAKVAGTMAKAPEKQKAKNKKPPKVRINPKKVGAVYYFGSAANQFNR